MPSPQCGYVKRRGSALGKGYWAAVRGAAFRRGKQFLGDPELREWTVTMQRDWPRPTLWPPFLLRDFFFLSSAMKSLSEPRLCSWDF